ncbi:DUF3658 domain-containing protein [Xanthomonas sp. XNM01]|mgnify:CR=1 FL=1|uniref:DUF3658 domain-containing protein n=1 Tax=Xanthomonas sp. XNM01 TaxID=2769289 RepID=UPI0017811AD7|nr:DUF3658 domain-containing protein [Xanthomonas sp. XNM01]MBD9370032.1 hypothetical protein [Xanthomonas sp. XNM01]
MPNTAALQAALQGMELEQDAQDAIARLQDSDLEQIDQAILSALGRDWKKAGFITAGVMIAAPDEHEELPEAFYALRIRALAQAGRIEVNGDLDALKTCDIRLPA